MTTLADRVARIRSLMQDAPLQTTLATAITDTTTATFDLADVTNVAKDTRIEIGSEVMLVTADPQGVTVTVLRGYEGTTPATHALNAPVLIDPRFIKANIVDAINVVLTQWIPAYFPRIVWDETTDTTFSTTKWIIKAPADAYQCLGIYMQFPAGYTRLIPISHGPLESFPTSIISTGLGVRLYEYDFVAGYTIHAQWAKRWTTLVADSDVEDSDFPVDGDDLIDQGALLYIVGLHHVPRFRMSEIASAREVSQPIPTVQNIQQMQSMAAQWIRRAGQVANTRPLMQNPPVVWIGKNG